MKPLMQAEPDSNESRFFNKEWYSWQNPDWCNKFDDAFEHYLSVGKKELRDPSPLVDMKRYHSVLGDLIGGDYFSAINQGVRDRAFGVYEDFNDLALSQKTFHDKIEIHTHKFKESNRKSKGLVFVQAGPLSLHQHWYDANTAEFDLLLNYYNPTGFDANEGDYVFSQVGTKFTAFAKLYAQYEAMFNSYEYVYLLDDDIYIDTHAINTMFDLCIRNQAAGAQPSLTQNSHCIWPVFFNQGTGIRQVNGVEIMMPVLSRELMRQCAPTFFESVSGFGLDLYISKLVQEHLSGKLYVFDTVQAVHDKPIDDSGGAYYENMRKNLINPKAELWSLVEKYGLPINFNNTESEEAIAA